MPPPNAEYSMIGSEKYVNSRRLIPKGQQFLPGSSTAFSVPFLGSFGGASGFHRE
ncbi:MAG: hypothetical protein M3Y53_08460 [Thermoproteota archaeon]|nr:hypothetical protein [Thermoproteota archaeon]